MASLLALNRGVLLTTYFKSSKQLSSSLVKKKILIHPETPKLKEKRWAHFPENAQAWLTPLRKNHGRITPTRPPNKALKHEGSVTNILGGLVDGWRPNALRRFYISYRASLIGLALAVKEAGNSKNECRRSYHDDRHDRKRRHSLVRNFPKVRTFEVHKSNSRNPKDEY